MKIFKIILVFLLSIGYVHSQTTEERKKITRDYNTSFFKSFKSETLNEALRAKKRAFAYAEKHNLEKHIDLPDGGIASLIDILDDNTLIYYRTYNADAALSTRTNHLHVNGSLDLSLEGQNMVAGVWDGGHPRESHQEYDGPGGDNRVLVMDTPLDLNFHAAHVTGTIASSGANPQAKGMAPRSQVHAYDWFSDLSEATDEAADGLLISNHSYGIDNSTVPNSWFGNYLNRARDWDILHFNSPHYLMVVSAGNDGTQNFNGLPLDPTYPEYDKLTGFATSKNNLVIANAQDAIVSPDGSLISVNINSSSSQGPTNDLRIKPDITGNGTSVTSTFHNSDSQYGILSGTSMSSPNVAGSLLLLQEHANNLSDEYFLAATLKGLVLHTADDAGPVGPDAIYGWGLLNTMKAANTMTKNGTTSLIQEITLEQGQSYSIEIDANEEEELIASISWTDPAGTTATIANDPTPKLVNDLDIRITQDTDTFFPWRLTGVNTNANDGDNFRDNFERIDISSASGTYTLTVTHKGTLTNGAQNFSLIVTGININCVESVIPSNLQASNIGSTNAIINWNLVPSNIYDLRFRQVGVDEWTIIEDISQPNYLLDELVTLTEYEVKVRSKCPNETPSDFSDSIFFTTTDLIYCDSQGNITNDEYISRVVFSNIDNVSADENGGYSDFTNIVANVVSGNDYSIEITPTWTSTIFHEGYAVWIDFNQNGSFDDPGELVFSQTPTQDSPVTGTISIPSNALKGTTRMRVTMKFGQIPPQPCETFTWGEVEDYSVRIFKGFIYQDGVWDPLDPSGISTTSDNITVINGSTLLSDDTATNNLAIFSDASLSTQNTINVANNILNDGTLTFTSNATSTGQLDTFSGSISGTGEVEVQRYIPARRAFRFLSSAVNSTESIRANWQENPSAWNDDPSPSFGTHITGLEPNPSINADSTDDGINGFDWQPSGNSSLFLFNNLTESWFAIDNTDINTLEAGAPYRLMVRGNRSIDLEENDSSPTPTTLRARGQLHTGSFTLDSSALSSSIYGYNLFGNPYQAAVDMTAVLNASDNLFPFIYVYDPTLGGTESRGSYVTVNVSGDGDNGTNNNTDSDANQYLQPGQAVFVQTLSNAPASLQFEESHKAVNQPLTSVFSTQSSVSLQLYDEASYQEGESSRDGIRIRFAEEYSNDLDQFDAQKMANQGENLASINSNSLLSIESRSMPFDGEAIPLFINSYQTTDYVIKANVEELPNVKTWLVDHYLDSSIELSNQESTVYPFQVNISQPASMDMFRFSLLFENETLATTDFEEVGFSIYPNPSKQGKFTIQSNRLNGEKSVVHIYDMLGQKVFSEILKASSNTTLEVNATGLSTGVYLVEWVQNGQSFSAKLMVE